MITGKHLAWAMEFQDVLPSGEWAALKALAKAADHKRGTGVVFARMSTLAAEASKSVRQLRTLIRRLEARGLALLVKGESSRRTNHWVLACSPDVLAAQEPRNLAEDRRFNRKSPPVSNRKPPPVTPAVSAAKYLDREKDSNLLDEPAATHRENAVHPSPGEVQSSGKEGGSGNEMPADRALDEPEPDAGDNRAPLSWDGLPEAVADLAAEWDRQPARLVSPRQKGHHPLIVAAAAWNRVAARHGLAPVKPWRMSEQAFRLVSDMWRADYRLFFASLAVLDGSPSGRRLCPTLEHLAAKLCGSEDWKRWLGADTWSQFETARQGKRP